MQEKCEFSEKWFEIEMVTYLRSRGGYMYSYSPSQRLEEEKGYDTRLTTADNTLVPMFLQFKVPTYNEGGHCQFLADYGDNKYYSFSLHKDKDDEFKQHNTLVKLAKQSGTIVAYCAPVFHTIDKFYEKMRDDSVYDNSIFIELKNLPRLAPGGSHYMTYSINGENALLHSDTYEVKYCSLSDFYSNKEDSTNKDAYSIDRLKGLFEYLEKEFLEEDYSQKEMGERYFRISHYFWKKHRIMFVIRNGGIG